MKEKSTAQAAHHVLIIDTGSLTHELMGSTMCIVFKDLEHTFTQL